jgi:hypothetical protein
MTRSLKASSRNLLSIVCSVCAGMLLVSCAAPLRIQSDFVPPGSLRLAQVTAIAKRSEILEIKDLVAVLKASGVNDADIVDGSVVMARIYCCGGVTLESSAEVVNARMMYVPKGVTVGLADVVEVRTALSPAGGITGALNTVTRVVQRYEENGPCRWDPDDESLWQRVIYCDWMPQEGWIRQEGLNPAWYKAPTPAPAGK